ncbi:MAG: hypothetical protein V3R62_05695, partial [Acidiferrobacterales bacterium]
TAADSTAGLAIAVAGYVDGLLHINMNNLPDAANGSTPIPTLVEMCPVDTECVDNFCDRTLSDGVTPREGRLCGPSKIGPVNT